MAIDKQTVRAVAEEARRGRLTISRTNAHCNEGDKRLAVCVLRVNLSNGDPIVDAAALVRWPPRPHARRRGHRARGRQ
jgi:hypothetical protein